MAKFCLLAEMILPNFLVKKMKVEDRRVVCVHGMCKKKMKKKSWRNVFTFWQKSEHTQELCEEKKLGQNLKIVQEYLEKQVEKRIEEYSAKALCPI